MRCKWIFRRDCRLVRICRIMWDRGTVGDGKGYSAKLTLGLYPRLWGWRHGRPYACPGSEWMLYFLFLRIHYQRAYGGIYV